MVLQVVFVQDGGEITDGAAGAVGVEDGDDTVELGTPGP